MGLLYVGDRFKDFKRLKFKWGFSCNHHQTQLRQKSANSLLRTTSAAAGEVARRFLQDTKGKVFAKRAKFFESNHL